MAKIKNKIIILGKHGFIAKRLCKELKKNKINFISFSKEKLNLEKKKSIKVLNKIVSAEDKIVFISAIAPVKNTDMLLRNIKILNNVSEALKGKLFNQLIYISSDAVFKDDAKIINAKTEKIPSSLHGNMHLLRENVLQNYFGSRLCILRPTLIYGAEDPHNGYGPNKFLRLVKINKNIELFGKGEEMRDHININDVVNVIKFCLLKNYIGNINVASGNLISFYNIAKVCIEKNKKCKINFLPRSGPMPHNGYRKFNIKRLKTLINISKFTNLKEYIKHY